MDAGPGIWTFFSRAARHIGALIVRISRLAFIAGIVPCGRVGALVASSIRGDRLLKRMLSGSISHLQ